MQYGHFDDQRREYVISTPATPLPWINYLGSEDFLGMISNTGGGYCFYRDAKLQRLLRYRYNAVPGDLGGRFYYLKEAGKSPWNPGFLPTKTPLDRYECRHGLGYSVFDSAKDGLAAKMTFFVPQGENCELHDLVLTNESREEKAVQVYGCMEWCLWNAVDDAQNYQRNLNIAESEVEPGVIYHKTEYRERRDHYAYYGVNVPTAGFDTDRNTFLGHMGDWSAPEQVRLGTSASSHITGWYPIACHRLDVTLAPGQSYRATFVLGYGQNPRDRKFLSPGVIRKDTAHRVMAKFADFQAVDQALDSLKAYWDGLVGAFRLESGNEKLSRMVNIWHPYQCMVTFNMSRSASYYETGTGRGMGFRDSCQDLLGFVHMVPQRARERIIDIASVQFADGSTYHQYQPLTKRGNNDIGGGFNDDPLWLVGAVCAYLKETGDFSLLDHPTPFDNVPGTEVPLLEHLRRSVNFTRNNLGPHRLPLIGRADWNDCLNLNCFSSEPGESFQTSGPSEGPVAESVFIGGMFVKYGGEYAQLCQRLGLADEAEDIRQAVKDMEAALLRDGWDGEWFLRAYDAAGRKVGSRECEEGKIFIEPQGFCVLAGVGLQTGQAKMALDSTRKHLLGEYGVELLHPCYESYHLELGEISSYPPGFKENGAVFCHNNPWIICAEARLGRGDEAFDIYRRICPAYLEEKSEIHETEPYVYAQMVTGRASGSPGHAKNSWLTGTASWTYLAVTQAILGICPEYDGLRISPCIPRDWTDYTVARRFRGSDYRIHVRQTGRPSMTVNGEPVSGSLVPLSPGRVTVEVTV
ncbi:MAG: glycosyl transferase [Eubacteriales bacterium]|nr:glycosyl transferase [Eubacteriales bacterium]